MLGQEDGVGYHGQLYWKTAFFFFFNSQRIRRVFGDWDGESQKEIPTLPSKSHHCSDAHSP